MMAQVPKYGQALRVIGQTLEELHLVAFSIKSEGKGYLIRGFAEECEPVQLRYTDADIRHIDQKRRAMRSDPSRMPDLRNLSQLLRTVGSYVEGKKGRLVLISKQLGVASSFTIQYDAGENHKEEKHLVSSLYDLCLRMYKRRRAVPPLSAVPAASPRRKGP